MKKRILFTLLGITVITITIFIVNNNKHIDLPLINTMPQVVVRPNREKVNTDNMPIWQEAINKSENAKDIIIINISIEIILGIVISAVLFITKIYKIDITSIICTLLLLIVPVAIYMQSIITYITNNVRTIS
ncbi:MAG: hypothetical protein IKF83_01900 [Clostridia bacterium]|nr:hypothetical protein [Clostridia bacterium]